MYKVYDDILPKDMVDNICDYVCHPSFIWHIGKHGRTLSDQFAIKYPNFQNNVQLIHPFLSRTQPWINGGIDGGYIKDYKLALFESNMINSMIIEFYKNIGENHNNKILHRIKANMLLESLDQTPNPPHIDICDEKHKVILMYMNDSDGDTIFYEDETGDKILDKITPKRGRIVFFDGHHYHSSSPPIKTSRRMVININIINKEDLHIIDK